VLAAAGLLSPRRLRRAGTAAGALRRAPRIRELVRSAAGRAPVAARMLARAGAVADGIDLARTAAHRYPLYGPAEGVVVNLHGRTPHGVVAPGAEYERVRDAAIEALTGLRDGAGRRPVEWAARREEVFDGPRAEAAPDVIALFRPEWKPVAGLGPVFQPAPPGLIDRYPGVHAMDGIFAAAGRGVPAGAELAPAAVVDVAPTILGLLGIGAAQPCDGRDLFAGGRRSPVPAPPASAHDAAAMILGEEEERAIERSLRALGYLE
jgi:predicted AlkP superfamily phosphohydrolase/phosphomutase